MIEAPTGRHGRHDRVAARRTGAGRADSCLEETPHRGAFSRCDPSPARSTSLGPSLGLLAFLPALLFCSSPASSQPRPEANAEDYLGMEVCAQCHDEIAAQVARTVHGATRMPDRIPAVLRGCEGCHGPGRAHVEEGDPEKIRRLSQATPEKRTEACLACHGGDNDRLNFRRSEHRLGEIACDSCHAPHGDGLHDYLLRDETNDLCFSCHTEARNDFALTYHHKVPEGSLLCTDCHDQHGGFSRQQRLFGSEQTCVRCHPDKQGPFAFEHLALRLEGCTGCHVPHGSNNPRLLIRREVSSLCLECHSRILSTEAEFSSVAVPPFHNLSQARYQSCTTCHVMIHGSNLSHVFFE